MYDGDGGVKNSGNREPSGDENSREYFNKGYLSGNASNYLVGAIFLILIILKTYKRK